MKKFLLKLLKTCLILILLLFGMHFTLDYYLSKENSCNNNTWHKIYEGKLNTDIAIIGTSRAECHYDTEIIEKITGLKTYNLGLSGNPYSVLKIRWESYSNRNKKPKILIIDIDESGLRSSKTPFNKFQYLPFLSSKEYQSFAKENENTIDFYFESYMPLYKYRGYETRIYKQLKSLKDRSICSNTINGYVENDIDWLEKDYLKFKELLRKDIIRTENDFQIHRQGLSVLEEIIKYCKKNDIKMYLVWSPSYYESHFYNATNKKYIDSILKDISRNEDIRYLNFSNDTLCYDRKFFYNSSHMNKRGSTIFSEKIGNLINEKQLLFTKD